ncbi:hypothetical protein HPB52_024194 [Rhipicephalus sanguineus]|uniref:Uncharacterized protein n=1 Tax=Rhipicephalus sanguineus TaxID=34632 RepID=A0A9D4PBL1_RHISA|nr:hypothetical protein HPB52_024194 [Rhipicephalus sanguineus]
MSYAEAVRRPPPCSTPGVVHPLQQMEVGFSPRNPPVVDDNVTLPPKSSVLTLVTCDVFDEFDEYEGIAEANGTST